MNRNILRENYKNREWVACLAEKCCVHLQSCYANDHLAPKSNIIVIGFTPNTHTCLLNFFPPCQAPNSNNPNPKTFLKMTAFFQFPTIMSESCNRDDLVFIGPWRVTASGFQTNILIRHTKQNSSESSGWNLIRPNLPVHLRSQHSLIFVYVLHDTFLH